MLCGPALPCLALPDRFHLRPRDRQPNLPHNLPSPPDVVSEAAWLGWLAGWLSILSVHSVSWSWWCGDDGDSCGGDELVCFSTVGDEGGSIALSVSYLPRLPIYLPLPTVHTSLGLLLLGVVMHFVLDVSSCLVCTTSTSPLTFFICHLLVRVPQSLTHSPACQPRLSSSCFPRSPVCLCHIFLNH